MPVSQGRARSALRESPASGLARPTYRVIRSSRRCLRRASASWAFPRSARLEIVADTTVGPWVVFQLFEKLKVDSARWDGGEAATVFRGKESPLFWVRLESQLQPGQVRTLTAYYHGDLIDRYVDFFDIKSSAGVVPALSGRPQPREIRSHLQHLQQLLAREHRRSGRFDA